MRVDRAADMTCSKMNHFFDLPATAKREGGGRWPAKPGPVEGEELGAVFDEAKLSRPLLRAVQVLARAGFKKGNFV